MDPALARLICQTASRDECLKPKTRQAIVRFLTVAGDGLCCQFAAKLDEFRRSSSTCDSRIAHTVERLYRRALEPS